MLNQRGQSLRLVFAAAIGFVVEHHMRHGLENNIISKLCFRLLRCKYEGYGEKFTINAPEIFSVFSCFSFRFFPFVFLIRS